MSQTARLTFPTSGVFALLLLVMHRFDGPLMQNKAVQWLGRVGLFSYSLYLTHTIVLRVAGQILQKAHLFPHLHLVAFVLRPSSFALGARMAFFCCLKSRFCHAAKSGRNQFRDCHKRPPSFENDPHSREQWVFR